MALSKARVRQVQTLLSAAGYYNGSIDGVLGDKSWKGITTLLNSRGKEATSDVTKWSSDRRAIGAAQLVLKYAGYSTMQIDGYWGNITEGAFVEWNHKRTTGGHLILPTTPVPGYTPKPTAFPKQSAVTSFYGAAGVGGAAEKQLIMVDLPFPMRIDWNLDQKATRVQLHKKCADSALAALRAIVQHYGEAELRRLGLDRNAGTYNPRRMRGGSSWSMHAYGCAWDFYAAPNGLNTRCPAALFCKPEYKAFFDIWEAHGWTSLGRAIGRDWMHVQAASL